MVASLQRFYGGDPERWLEVPFYLVRALAEKMEAVEAGEALRAVEVAALGSGGYGKETARRLLDEMQRKASGGRGRRAQRLPPGMLANVGIGVGVQIAEKPKDGPLLQHHPPSNLPPEGEDFLPPPPGGEVCHGGG
ncbi:MAG: hypothetical protein AAB368_03470 [bacterium]